MGIFPIKCDVCNTFFVPGHSHIHCITLEKELESANKSLALKIDMISKIIDAYRKQEGLDDAILAAAYEFGYSVSREKFVWLDEEMKRLKELKEKK